MQPISLDETEKKGGGREHVVPIIEWATGLTKPPEFKKP